MYPPTPYILKSKDIFIRWTLNTSSCPSKQMSALYYQSHFVWKTCSQFPFLRASMPAWRQCLLFRFYIIRRKNMTCRSSSRKKLSIWKLLLLEVIGIDIFHVAILPHKWKKKASLLSSGIQASSIIHIPSFLCHIWRGKVVCNT